MCENMNFLIVFSNKPINQTDPNKTNVNSLVQSFFKKQ